MRGLALAALVTTLILASNVFAAEDCSKCRCTSYPVEKSCETCCVLGGATALLKEMLTGSNGIPTSVLDKALCVLVYPAGRKAGVGLGANYGRGVLVCRSGKTMNGNWGAPIIYTLETGLGSSSTDYVLLIMSPRGASKVLSGSLKLGADVTVSTGPSVSQASGFNEPNVDILAYSGAKGAVAGASLGSAYMKPDDQANKLLYGKEVDAMQIASGDVRTPAAAQALISVLEKASPKHM